MSVDVFSAPVEPIGPNVRNSKSSTSANPIPSLPSLEHQCPDVVTNLLEKESQAQLAKLTSVGYMDKTYNTNS